MTKTLTYIHILPRMHVLLFLCDSKVSLAVARRASDVWDLSSRSSGCRVTFNSTVGKLGVAHLFENPWVAVRVSRHQKTNPWIKKGLGDNVLDASTVKIRIIIRIDVCMRHMKLWWTLPSAASTLSPQLSFFLLASNCLNDRSWPLRSARGGFLNEEKPRGETDYLNER